MTAHAPRRAARGATAPDSLPASPLDDIVLGKPPKIPRDASTVEQLRAGLDTRLRALIAHVPGTRVGTDPEQLHQMRVAVRRMRATLKAARPLLDAGWTDGLRAELGWLGRALGPVRDADVLLDRLRGRASAFDQACAVATETLLARLVTRREQARAEMLDTLGSDRYVKLIRTLAEAMRAPLPAAPARSKTPSLTDLARTEYRKLAKAADRLGPDPTDKALHDLRIRGKRLRYTAELAATAAGKPMRKLVKATVAVQDVLGEHQDACVAQHQVLTLLDELGDVVDFDVVFAAGRLVQVEEGARLASRQQWDGAWHEVRRRARFLTP